MHLPLGPLLLPTPSSPQAQLSSPAPFTRHLLSTGRSTLLHPPSSSLEPWRRGSCNPHLQKRSESGEIPEQHSWHREGHYLCPSSPSSCLKASSPPPPRVAGGGRELEPTAVICPLPSAAWPTWGRGQKGSALNPGTQGRFPLPHRPLCKAWEPSSGLEDWLARARPSSAASPW